MEITNSHIIPQTKIVDDDFNLELAEAFELSILIGSKQFSFAIIDPLHFKLYWLETYSFEDALLSEQLIATLTTLFNQNEALQNGFWKSIQVGMVHNKSTLIPEALFDEDHVQNYFQVNCAYNPEAEQILLHRHKNAGIINLFAAEHALLDFLKAQYSSRKINFLPIGSTLIEGVLHYPAQTDPTIYINLSHEMASYTIKTGNELKYFNSFHAIDFKDLLYYTLFIAEEFNYEQENLKVIIWGNTGLENDYQLALRAYIGTVVLGDRPTGVAANYKFSDIPKHQHFDLLAMSLCS